MATASPVQSSRTTLHVRGNWSAREDRIASAVWLAILWAGMIAGFGVDLPRYLHQNPPAPVIIHIHAAVFTTWMLLLTAQVLLVLRNRIASHRTFGWFLVAWAGLMAILGPCAAFASQAATLNTLHSFTPFLSVNLVDIVGFLALLAWGIALRKNPAAHKRMMILATISLADPGFSRFLGFLVPAFPANTFQFFVDIFYGNVLLIVLMAAWDLWKRRLMRSFVIGAAALLAAEYAASALFYWPPWQSLTLTAVQAWAKHFS